MCLLPLRSRRISGAAFMLAHHERIRHAEFWNVYALDLNIDNGCLVGVGKLKARAFVDGWWQPQLGTLYYTIYTIYLLYNIFWLEDNFGSKKNVCFLLGKLCRW